MKSKIFWIGWILCIEVLAQSKGDLNSDGTVDIADLVRGQMIERGELPFAAAADLDGDGTITPADVWLIQEAVLGRPVPELAASALIGADGGTLTDGAFTLTVAPGTAVPTRLVLWRCTGDALEEGTGLEDVYMISGLSSDLAASEITFAESRADQGICLGSYATPYDGDEAKWRWRPLPESSLTRSGSTLSAILEAVPAFESGPPASGIVKCGLAAFAAPPPLTEQLSARAYRAPLEASVPGHKYAGYVYAGWISDQFHVYTDDWGSVSYDDLKKVCGYLYDIHAKLKAIGFPLDTTDAAIFPVEVYVEKGISDEGYMMSIPGMKPYLVINAKSLITNNLLETDEMRATLGHEMMHLVLARYNRGDKYAFGAIEDAVTTWFEQVANDNPERLSSNYKARPAAPLKSLFKATSLWQGWDPVQKHGYAVSAFIDQHFSGAHQGSVYALAQQVKSGKTIEQALDAVLTALYGSALNDLEREYRHFVRDYLLTVPESYSSAIGPLTLLSGDQATDTSKMYRSFSYKKAAPTLWEEEEQAFTVQDYGCGILEFKLYKPKTFFAPGTKLRVVAPDLCSGLELVMHYRQDGVPGSTSVSGVYTDTPDGHVWEAAIEVPTEAVFVQFFAAATMGNRGTLSDFKETHDITLVYQFEGDLYLPPFESYYGFLEREPNQRHYRTHVLADATFRIVDPLNEGGLTGFEIFRNTVSDGNQLWASWPIFGYSYAFADRRERGAFQLRLFSHATVMDPDPFTFDNGFVDDPALLSYDGFPIVGGDGNPQLEVEVFHLPPSATELSDTYRIEHRIVSVPDLRQAANKIDGGILLDIPAEVEGYALMIGVNALYDDAKYPGEVNFPVFYLSVGPKK